MNMGCRSGCSIIEDFMPTRLACGLLQSSKEFGWSSPRERFPHHAGLVTPTSKNGLPGPNKMQEICFPKVSEINFSGLGTPESTCLSTYVLILTGLLSIVDRFVQRFWSERPYLGLCWPWLGPAGLMFETFDSSTPLHRQRRCDAT